MRTSISKKLLAGALSVMMVLSLVAPTGAQAASKYSVTGYKTVKAGKTYTYKIKGVKKSQYVKVQRNVSGETVKYNKKALTAKKQVKGTGKNLTLKVKFSEKNKNYTGKFTVRIYNAKSNKLVKKIVKSVNVKTQKTAKVAVESVALDNTTPKVGDTLTATVEPAKATNVKYTWLADGTAIEGATASTYTVTEAELGKKISVKVTGDKDSSATSAETEAVKAVEATLVSVEATGSKQLTATLSSKVEVKAADFTITGTASSPKATAVAADEKDATKIKITLASKMLAGTYTVTYKGVSKEVIVKDETLTTLAPVGTVLAETSRAPGANTAAIGYQALNQYGERMLLPGSLAVACSFGTAAETKAATTSKDGEISVTGISDILAIAGTKGSLTLTDTRTGVTSTTEITYGDPATLAKMEVVGIYDISNAAYVETIPEEADGSNYRLVVKAENQYGQAMDTNAINKDKTGATSNNTLTTAQIQTTLSIAGTKLDNTNMEDVTIKNESYPAIKFGGASVKAGELNIIVVNSKKGSVLNTKVTVSQMTLVKSMTFSQIDMITFGDENEIAYNVIGTDGKEITKYSVLKKLITFTNTDFAWKETSTGAGKLVFTPSAKSCTAPTKGNPQMVSVSFTANVAVNPAKVVTEVKQFNVYEQRKPTAIAKYKGKQAFVLSGSAYKMNKTRFVIEDQYGTAMTSGMANYDTITNANIETTFIETAGAGTTFSETQAAGATTIALPNTITPAAAAGTVKMYVKYTAGATGNTALTEDTADAVFTLTNGNAQDATNLKIKYVHDGYAVWIVPTDTTSGLTEADIKVVGTIEGKEVTIPTSQYSITKDTFKQIDGTKSPAMYEAEITIAVETTEGTDKVKTELTAKYEYGNVPAVIGELYNYNDYEGTEGNLALYAGSTSATFDKTQMNKAFYVIDQYDNERNPTPKEAVAYTAVYKSGDEISISNNGQKKIAITNIDATPTGTTVIELTAVINGLEAKQNVEINWSADPNLPSTLGSATITFAKMTGDVATTTQIATLSGTAVAGTTYKLQKSANGTTGWTDVQTLAETSGSIKTSAQLDVKAATYYRILAVPADSTINSEATQAMVNDKTDAAVFGSATFTKKNSTLTWESSDVVDQFGDAFTLTAVSAPVTVTPGTDDAVTATMTTVSAGGAEITFVAPGADSKHIAAATKPAVDFGSEISLTVTFATVADSTQLAHGDITAVTVTAQ